MKTVTLWCEAGKHHWERPSQRGRRPTSCPAHTEQPQQPKRVREETEEPSRDMTAAHEGRRRAAEEREQERIEKKKSSLAKSKASLDSLYQAYEKAFKEANRISEKRGVERFEINQAWDRVDARQRQYIGTSQQIDRLEKELSYVS